MSTVLSPALTIAVTGAGGFIGGRLAEMLDEIPGAVTVRRIARRGAGPGTFVMRLDSEDAVRSVLRGCHAVVHCAFDAYSPDSNLAMAATLGRVCALEGVRLVHVSTAAVYEPLPDGTLTEAAPTTTPGTAYKDVKLAIEQHLLDMVDSAHLDLVILQPTIVYGPGGGAWTDSPIRELLTGEVMLPDAGEGLCNAVYVDDVCRAAIAACTARLASGERILVSGPDPVRWLDFLGAYDKMLGTNALRLEPAGRSAPTLDGTPVPQSASGNRLKQIVRQLILARIGASGRSRLNMMIQRARLKLRGKVVFRAAGPKRALYEARCTVSIAKAEKLCGYRPLFDLTSGMEATHNYIQRVYGGVDRGD